MIDGGGDSDLLWIRFVVVLHRVRLVVPTRSLYLDFDVFAAAFGNTAVTIKSAAGLDL